MPVWARSELNACLPGLLVCSVALVLSTIGLLRNERPRWPGILAFALSVIPGAIGFFIGIVVLVKLIARTALYDAASMV